jgi:hypothetical protein
MAEAVVTVAASTAVVALAAEDSVAADFPAAAFVVARTAVITEADTAMDAVLMAVATAEEVAPMAAAVTEECTAPPVPITLGHPKVGVFATHPQAGIRLNPAAPTPVVG